MEDDDDADLEAELLALTGESNVAIRAKKGLQYVFKVMWFSNKSNLFMIHLFNPTTV